MSGLDLDAILDDELRAIAASAAHAERVPAHAIVDMLQICAAVAGRPDLGVAFAQWGNIRGYGPLSLLWDHCPTRSEEHTSELQSLMRNSYAVFCLQKKKQKKQTDNQLTKLR